MSNRKKILITGASGLVGTHLIKAISKNDIDIIAGFHTKKNTELISNVSWKHCDILDVVELGELMQGVDTVYHCAASVSFLPDEKRKLFNTNAIGTANVVNACLEKGVKKLIHVSSVAALGRIREGQQINETMHWTAETSNSLYGQSKFLAEQEIWRGMAEGLDIVVVNPVIILGESDWNTGSSAIFKSIYNEFPWYTDGVTGFVDVEDVVKALIAIDEAEIVGERFILSAGNFSYLELFTMIANAFNKKIPYKKVSPLLAGIIWRWENIKYKLTHIKPLLTRETARTAQAKSYFDNSKLLKAIPAFSYTPLEDSVKRICAAYMKNN